MRKARDPRRRPLRHPERQDRHLRRLHQQHAVGRVPLLRRAAGAVRDRDPISTSAPRSLASIRSRSAASTPCATARSPIPSSSSKSVSLLRALDAAEKASRWEPGAPISRGATRGDLGGDGTRAAPARSARVSRAAERASLAERGRVMAKKRGRGVAACWYGIARTATVDRAGAWAEIDDGGTAKIVTGVTEIGEGILTVLAQIAAEELGVRPAGRHHRRQRHGALAGSGACRRHAPDLHDRQCRRARLPRGARQAGRGDRRALGRRSDTDPHRRRRDLGRGHQSPHVRWTRRSHLCKQRGVVPLGSGIVPAPTPPASIRSMAAAGPWQAYVFGCQVAEVEVDTVTGEVQVLGIWAAHDVGRAVNPRGVEGQIEGGIVQALGQGLMEDYQTQGRAHDHARLRQIHPADLARRAARHLGHRRGPRSDRPARRERHRRAGHDSDHSRRHERDL